MAIETSYSELRAHLAEYMDRIVDDRDVVVVRRRNGKHVALIDADELSFLMETAHVLSSPVNAERLHAALRDVREGKVKPEGLDDLRQEFGFEKP